MHVLKCLRTKLKQYRPVTKSIQNVIPRTLVVLKPSESYDHHDFHSWQILKLN